jgi:2-polyprenyl-6-methoxyphenol hydroxylase-like FAD-dependent oxidoreductase
MAKIVVVGGGICGLGASMMLARRGHEVVVLERNPEDPPETIDKAWDAWERTGVAQFRMGHWFMARWHQIIKRELPDLLPQFAAAGALCVNIAVDVMPDTITDRSRREDDDQFDVVTGRRPIFEWVFARAAAVEPGIEIRRGVGVSGLLTGRSHVDGVPHVVGVRTESGEEIAADLVIDAGGRRSALATWLTDIGAKPFFEESEDSGFRYYGRYFQQSAAGTKAPIRPMLAMLGSAAVIALPADNDTWMVGVITSSKDKALYTLTDADAWHGVVAATPDVAPYLDGDPITPIETMMAIPDRYRRFVVDGQPVVTGIAPIGDAWAATNPMRGRGISMGFMQAEIVVNNVGQLDDPVAFTLAVDAQTEAEVTPYYHATVQLDRAMRDAFEREVAGEPPPEPDPNDPIAAMQEKFFGLAAVDPDAWRGFMKIVHILDDPMNVVASEPILSKVLAYEGPSDNPFMAADGPSREELVAIAAGAKSGAGPMHRFDELLATS